MCLHSLRIMATGIALALPSSDGLVAEPGQVGVDVGQPSAIRPYVPGPDFVNTAEPAVPGAQEVVGDVQSVMFWSRFQRGTTKGWHYVLFPDGSATITEDNERKEAAFTLVCVSGEACDVTRSDGTSFTIPATGAPRPDGATISDGESLSRHLAEWVLAGTGSPPADPAMAAESNETASPRQSATAHDAKPASTDPVAPEGRRPNEASAVAPRVLLTEAAEPNVAAEPANRERSRRVGSNKPTSSSCPDLPGFVPNVCDETESSGSTPREALARGGAQPIVDATPPETPQDETGRLSFRERSELKCYATGTFNLRYSDPNGTSSGPGNPRVSLGCGGKITERLSFQFVLREYLVPEQQQPWDPDFTYAFTYRISERFNLTFSNYLARFDGPSGEGNTFDSLRDGNLRANYKLPRYELPNGEALACVAGVGLPNVLEERFSFSCGLGITKKLRLGGTAYFYLPGNQGTYDPDFSYTASYKINDSFRVTYSNYSNNRWNWNEGDSKGPGFVGGSLSLTHMFEF